MLAEGTEHAACIYFIFQIAGGKLFAGSAQFLPLRRNGTEHNEQDKIQDHHNACRIGAGKIDGGYHQPAYCNLPCAGQSVNGITNGAENGFAHLPDEFYHIIGQSVPPPAAFFQTGGHGHNQCQQHGFQYEKSKKDGHHTGNIQIAVISAAGKDTHGQGCDAKP